MRPLRVGTLDDKAAARHLHRAIQDLATPGLNPLDGGVNPLDTKIRAAKAAHAKQSLPAVLGVDLADSMMAHDFVVLGEEAGEVTSTGTEFLRRLGVDLAAARAKRRVFCRPCLDWTERRLHIGGAVGAALAKRCL